jgi:hypothetical protein
LGTEKIHFDDREQARTALMKGKKWLGVLNYQEKLRLGTCALIMYHLGLVLFFYRAIVWLGYYSHASPLVDN